MRLALWMLSLLAAASLSWAIRGQVDHKARAGDLASQQAAKYEPVRNELLKLRSGLKTGLRLVDLSQLRLRINQENELAGLPSNMIRLNHYLDGVAFFASRENGDGFDLFSGYVQDQMKLYGVQATPDDHYYSARSCRQQCFEKALTEIDNLVSTLDRRQAPPARYPR